MGGEWTVQPGMWSRPGGRGFALSQGTVQWLGFSSQFLGIMRSLCVSKSVLKYCNLFVWCSHSASRKWTYLEQKSWISPWKWSFSTPFIAGDMRVLRERLSYPLSGGRARTRWHLLTCVSVWLIDVGWDGGSGKGSRWCAVNLTGLHYS